MTHTYNSTRPYKVDAVAFINHLSGLNAFMRAEIASILCPQSLLKQCLPYIVSQAAKEKRDVIFKRAESYVKEYRDAEREKIRLTRLSKQDGTYYVPGEPKLVFVVRIKG